jgi:hypothetical protein
MKIKVIMAIIVLTFSVSASATTVEDLIKAHGKRAVMDVIASKIHKKFTIVIDGEIRQAHAPSEEYINASTLAADIERAGMTPSSVETAFAERAAQARIQKAQEAEEYRRRAELDEKERQQAIDRREEEAKFLANASNEEREQFRTAQLKGIRMAALQAHAQRQRAYGQQETVIEQPSSSNPVCAISRDKVSSDLKGYFANKYPDSYSTQEMLHNAGMKDYDYLCSLTMGNVEIGVINKVLSRYYPSMSTIKILFEHNMASYRRLHQ